MRRTALRRANPERRAKVFARTFGDRGAAVRAMSCLVRGCHLPAQAAHAIARGMGGAKGTLRHLVPLCSGHHLEAGEYRTSARARFEERHGLDLLAEAERIAVLLDDPTHDPNPTPF
jgi:hypothetical protein